MGSFVDEVEWLAGSAFDKFRFQDLFIFGLTLKLVGLVPRVAFELLFFSNLLRFLFSLSFSMNWITHYIQNEIFSLKPLASSSYKKCGAKGSKWKIHLIENCYYYLMPSKPNLLQAMERYMYLK